MNQKSVGKPKETAKRRKDKEEDPDDLEESEERPEKKLKDPYQTFAEVHSFKDLASALEFRKSLIEKLEGKKEKEKKEEDDEEESEDDVGGSGIAYFDKNSKEYVYDGFCGDSDYCIQIKELTVDEFLNGKDLNIQLFGK